MHTLFLRSQHEYYCYYYYYTAIVRMPSTSRRHGSSSSRNTRRLPRGVLLSPWLSGGGAQHPWREGAPHPPWVGGGAARGGCRCRCTPPVGRWVGGLPGCAQSSPACMPSGRQEEGSAGIAEGCNAASAPLRPPTLPPWSATRRPQAHAPRPPCHPSSRTWRPTWQCSLLRSRVRLRGSSLPAPAHAGRGRGGGGVGAGTAPQRPSR